MVLGGRECEIILLVKVFILICFIFVCVDWIFGEYIVGDLIFSYLDKEFIGLFVLLFVIGDLGLGFVLVIEM